MNLFGGIEAGGTKFVCAVGNESGEIHSEIRFPTASQRRVSVWLSSSFESIRRQNR